MRSAWAGLTSAWHWVLDREAEWLTKTTPRLRIVVLAIVLTYLWLSGLAGSSRLSGPVLFELSGTHGVHLDDLITSSIWLGAMRFCWWAWHHRGPRG